MRFTERVITTPSFGFRFKASSDSYDFSTIPRILDIYLYFRIRHSFAHLRPVILSADWSISRLQSWTCSRLPTVAEFVKLTQSIVIEIQRQSADLYKVQLCNRQFFVVSTAIYVVKVYECHPLDYTPIAFDERVTFGFNAPGHCLVSVRLLHCMRVRLRNGYTRAYAQIMQHTHTHKTVTGRVEARKLLSRRRQSNYSEEIWTSSLHWYQKRTNSSSFDNGPLMTSETHAKKPWFYGFSLKIGIFFFNFINGFLLLTFTLPTGITNRKLFNIKDIHYRSLHAEDGWFNIQYKDTSIRKIRKHEEYRLKQTQNP